MDETPRIFPPGVRFHPSDQALINYYLHRKVKCLPLPQNVIKEIQLYKYNPWDLPRRALYGENEWYFFTPRDRKYPNGGRPNRTTESGYWKATGTDKPILSSSKSKQIGVKKTLVFYMGKPPSRQKMDWVMTEYRLPDASRPSRAKGSMRLDDWVICRIRQKGNMSKNAEEELDTENHSSDELLDYVPMHEDLPPLHNETYNRGKDILSDHLRSSQHRELAGLLIGDGKIVDSQTPIFSTFGNVIGASQDGQIATTAMAATAPDVQRGMTYCPLEDNNLRASFRTNYTYWLNVYQGNVVNPSYGTNSYCHMAGGLDMPALY